MEPIVLWGLSGVLVIAGLAGLVAPVLPGAPLIFLGCVSAAWAENFERVGVTTLVVLGVMGAATYAVDFAAGAFGAKKFGASRRAAMGAVLGAIAGLFFGIAGILLGPFVGATLGELSTHGDVERASRAGFGATLGLAVGAALKLTLGIAMVGIFAIVRASSS